MEDGAGLCGYIVATPDVKDYQEKWRDEWRPLMQKKYPKPKTEKRENMTMSEVGLTYNLFEKKKILKS